VLHAWQEDGKKSQRGEPSGQFVDSEDAVGICQVAQHGGANAAHAEREAEEQSGNHADAAGDEFLPISENGREGRRQDEEDGSSGSGQEAEWIRSTCDTAL